MFVFYAINANIGSVAIADIAKTFRVNTYIIGYIFTLSSLGAALATLMSGWLVKKIPAKQLNYAAIFLIVIGYAIITFGTRVFVYACGVFVIGIGTGMMFYLANYFIVNLYEGKYRTVQLNALNFFYSFGAVISPLATGMLLKRQVSWEAVYQLATILLVPLLLLAASAKFQGRGNAKAEPDAHATEHWHINVYLVGLAFIFYALAEVVFTNWIVVYLRQVLFIDVETAGMALAVFWAFMAVGRLASGVITAVVRIEKFLMWSAVVAFSAYAAVLASTHVSLIFTMIAFMGLGFSGMYASIFSYGTMQVRHPTANLISFYMSLSSVGGISCYLISSYLVQEFGLYDCLTVSACSMGIVGFIIAACIFNARKYNVIKTEE
jgi:TsgA-like MFS transporter